MSMLDQAAGRRLTALLYAPLPRNAEIAAAWDRGEAIEWRWSFVGDRWKPCHRVRHFGTHTYTYVPNWQNEDIEFRIVRPEPPR